MARVRKIPVGDQLVDVIEVDFSVVREEWNEYALADGGRVKMKASVIKIFRVLDADGKPAYTPEGDPNIIINSANQASATE